MISQSILIDGLQELANKEMQMRYWVYGNDNEMSSFEEAICMVFDDAGLTRAMEKGYLKKNFSEELCRKVSELDKALDSIPQNVRPEEQIENPYMETVRAIAQDLLILFSKEGISEDK